MSHACGLRANGQLVCWGSDFSGSTTPPAGSFAQVDAGHDYSCAVRSDGSLACWGWNDRGQASPPAGEFQTVAAGYQHSCGLRVDGRLACWGDEHDGQTSPPEGSYAQVSVGECHSCALDRDGRLRCWGCSPDAAPGEVGPGGGLGRNTPPSGEDFVAVQVGYLHSCALRAEGSIDCWGHNAIGQAAPPAGRYAALDAGFYHTCALRQAGGAACWGWPAVLPQPTAPGAATPDPYNEIPERFQQHSCPHEGLGLLYLRQGRTDLAQHSLEAAVEVNPDEEFRKYNALASIHMEAGRYREAQTALLKSIQIQPLDNEAFRLMEELKTAQR